MSVEPYFIPQNTSIFELNVKKSLFIAKAQYVDDPLTVREIIKKEKEIYKGYTHVVHGFRIGRPNSEICGMSDDGEPVHTAGKPILSVIQLSNITNIIITVVRYFGGIKLGTGGLVRAYTESAKGCIENIDLKEVKDLTRFNIIIEYSYFDILKKMLEQIGADIIEEVFTDKVNIIFDIDSCECVTVEKTLVELTNNNIQFFEPDLKNSNK